MSPPEFVIPGNAGIRSIRLDPATLLDAGLCRHDLSRSAEYAAVRMGVSTWCYSSLSAGGVAVIAN